MEIMQEDFRIRWPSGESGGEAGGESRRHPVAGVRRQPRQSQAAPFDQIVVMQAGRVAMQGTKTELEARGGLYAELMASA